MVVAIRCQVLLEDCLISLPRLDGIKGSGARIGNMCRAVACKYDRTASFRNGSLCKARDCGPRPLGVSRARSRLRARYLGPSLDRVRFFFEYFMSRDEFDSGPKRIARVETDYIIPRQK